MALRRSGGRKYAKKAAVAGGVTAVCAVAAAAILWHGIGDRMSANRFEGAGASSEGRPPDALVAEALAANAAEGGDISGAAALADALRKSGISPSNALESSPLEIAPRLNTILEDENRSARIRGHALHALFLIQPSKAKSHAAEFEEAPGYLGEVASGITGNDPRWKKRETLIQSITQ
jgi:hypothetical protein